MDLLPGFTTYVPYGISLSFRPSAERANLVVRAAKFVQPERRSTDNSAIVLEFVKKEPLLADRIPSVELADEAQLVSGLILAGSEAFSDLQFNKALCVNATVLKEACESLECETKTLVYDSNCLLQCVHHTFSTGEIEIAVPIETLRVNFKDIMYQTATFGIPPINSIYFEGLEFVLQESLKHAPSVVRNDPPASHFEAGDTMDFYRFRDERTGKGFTRVVLPYGIVNEYTIPNLLVFRPQWNIIGEQYQYVHPVEVKCIGHRFMFCGTSIIMYRNNRKKGERIANTLLVDVPSDVCAVKLCGCQCGRLPLVHSHTVRIVHNAVVEALNVLESCNVVNADVSRVDIQAYIYNKLSMHELDLVNKKITYIMQFLEFDEHGKFVCLNANYLQVTEANHKK